LLVSRLAGSSRWSDRDCSGQDKSQLFQFQSGLLGGEATGLSHALQLSAIKDLARKQGLCFKYSLIAFMLAIPTFHHVLCGLACLERYIKKEPNERQWQQKMSIENRSG